MLAIRRALCRGLVLAALFMPGIRVLDAAAQASPYVPLDHPDLPFIEHLIARGDLIDPSPMVRPFRRDQLLRALEQADSSASPLIGLLRERFAAPEGEVTYEIDPRAGVQAFTSARRDALHPAGPDGARPVMSLGLRARFGDHLIAATRPMIEPRITDDPDWPGRRDVTVATRFPEAYLSAQFQYVRVFYGQLQHNWGPVGIPGIPISNYGYTREGLGIELGVPELHLAALGTQLRDEVDSLGQVVHRYYFVHRIGTRPSPGLSLSLWEGVIVAGAGRTFEARYRNPLTLNYLANALGLGDRSNSMLGADLHWRAFGRTTLEAQLALDDFWYENRSENRDRWALTLAAFGPLGSRASWRAMYTQVSSLALRAFNPFENFNDAGVGVGRNFTDLDRASLWVTVPVRRGWLVTPELTVLRQGEGRLNTPYPPAGPERRNTPALFIGTVERTYRAALGVVGREGPITVSANGGFHHVVNADHEPGETDNRFEGRLTVSIDLDYAGTIRPGF